MVAICFLQHEPAQTHTVVGYSVTNVCAILRGLVWKGVFALPPTSTLGAIVLARARIVKKSSDGPGLGPD